MNRLLDKYKSVVIPALTSKFSYSNVMQVPRLEKIVINVAAGDSVGNSRALDAAVNDISIISGQKPILTLAKSLFRSYNHCKGGFLYGCKVNCKYARFVR